MEQLRVMRTRWHFVVWGHPVSTTREVVMFQSLLLWLGSQTPRGQIWGISASSYEAQQTYINHWKVRCNQMTFIHAAFHRLTRQTLDTRLRLENKRPALSFRGLIIVLLPGDVIKPHATTELQLTRFLGIRSKGKVSGGKEKEQR